MNGALPRFDDLTSTSGLEMGFGALETDKGPLPLKAMDVKARITGLIYDLKVIQTFMNTHEEPIEAVYIFPLPPRAAVNGFSMKVGDHLVEGKLQERGEARKGYEEALAAGKRASMAEEDRPNVFTLSVGNLMPGDVAEVSFRLSGLLALNGDQAEWRFPLVVAPRYIPGVPLGLEPAGMGVDMDTDQVPDASRLNPPVLLPGFPNPVRLGIEVQLDPCGLSYLDLSSSLHAVDIETRGASRRVRLAYEERLNRDFVLRFRLPEESLQCFATLIPDAGNPGSMESDGDATLMVTLVPPQPLPSERPLKDVVFVLDRSGSMDGWKIVAARRAMARMVDTLGPDDRFGVIAFDTELATFGLTHEGLLTATDLNRFRAAEFLARIEVDGGTEMLPPIQKALEVLGIRDGQREKIIFLVTDGQIGNEGRMVQEVQKRHAGCRFQILGIGDSANDSLLQRMAAKSEGWFLAAESERALDKTLLEAARRFGQPVVRDLSVKAPGLIQADVVSSGSMDLYPGCPVILLARVVACKELKVIDLKGTKGKEGKFAQQIPVERSVTDGVRNIWARWKIRDMEDAQCKAEDIVHVSLAHGVLSRFTAFLAVDERGVVNPNGIPTSLLQPVEEVEDRANVCGLIRSCLSSAPLMHMSVMAGSPTFFDEEDCVPFSLPGGPSGYQHTAGSFPMDSEANSTLLDSLQGASYEEALAHARGLLDLLAESPSIPRKPWLNVLKTEMAKLGEWLKANHLEEGEAGMAFMELLDRIPSSWHGASQLHSQRIVDQAMLACQNLYDWLVEIRSSGSRSVTTRTFWEE